MENSSLASRRILSFKVQCKESGVTISTRLPGNSSRSYFKEMKYLQLQASNHLRLIIPYFTTRKNYYLGFRLSIMVLGELIPDRLQQQYCLINHVLRKENSRSNCSRRQIETRPGKIAFPGLVSSLAFSPIVRLEATC